MLRKAEPLPWSLRASGLLRLEMHWVYVLQTPARHAKPFRHTEDPQLRQPQTNLLVGGRAWDPTAAAAVPSPGPDKKGVSAMCRLLSTCRPLVAQTPAKPRAA